MASSCIKEQKYVEDKSEDRLSKRLCYILRYGALKEGLDVLDGGWLNIGVSLYITFACTFYCLTFVLHN